MWRKRFGGVRGWRPTAPGRSRLMAVMLAVTVFVLPAAATLQLKHVGEAGVQADRDLQAAVTELRIQDGWEWRLISGRVPAREVAAGLAASRDRSNMLLARARSGGLSVGGAGQVAGAGRDYSQAVDEELRLLTAGQADQALELDETRVDPAFARALHVLDSQARQVSRRAGRARTLSDAGVLLTVALSLLLTSVVAGRRRRAQVRDQAERVSDDRYRALIDQSSDVVLVVDRTGAAHYLSPSAERLFTRPGGTHPALWGPRAPAGLS